MTTPLPLTPFDTAVAGARIGAQRVCETLALMVMVREALELEAAAQKLGVGSLRTLDDEAVSAMWGAIGGFAFDETH